MQYTIFLDRDGVINVDSPDYIKKPSEFEFIPKSRQAVALLNQNNFQIIIITNQSIIGRKMVSQKTLDAIFNKMRKGVETADGKIKDIFFCPHTPDDKCSCRKPKPKMILDAAKKYDIDLSLSIMVGDSSKDIECAINAGCGKTILVQTGNGKKARQTLSQQGIAPDAISANLYDAALWIINNVKN
ncbi:MAG: D-glycero-beta-D-manno-heptose 1,7-bisphosphate 7-phosphatase [Desulfobacula sp.]|nr:D-glycero-beta-D-manno-heptose 1,7-bisphosphate 7-phosphatase [Desulfobacula sp.]